MPPSSDGDPWTCASGGCCLSALWSHWRRSCSSMSKRPTSARRRRWSGVRLFEIDKPASAASRYASRSDRSGVGPGESASSLS